MLVFEQAFIAIGPFSLLELADESVTTLQGKGVDEGANEEEEMEEEEKPTHKAHEVEDEDKVAGREMVKAKAAKVFHKEEEKAEAEAEEKKVMSPFNVKDSFPSPAWTSEEIQHLFKQYEKERQCTVSPEIVKDIFERTSG